MVINHPWQRSCSIDARETGLSLEIIADFRGWEINQPCVASNY